MKFSTFPLAEAEGAILAHSIATPQGTLKKGRVLSAADIARLAETGRKDVIAARLQAGDIGEDEAAARIARAAAGMNTHVSAPFTGRANLFASGAGLAIIDASRLARINALDEGLTVATVPNMERVTAGQMIVTVKVITFALSETVVAEAERLLRATPSLAIVKTFTPRTAGLILTRMPATKASVLAKRRAAIEDRLQALGSELGPVESVAHQDADVSAAIGRMKAAGANPIILFAASAIVDRGDVIPAALVEAGGEVIRLGMPVDPGNLMLLGRLGPIDVIGAPSCAASPKLNGFDWVLERRLADVDVRTEDIAAMGLGGLLKEIATRPQPRETRPGATDVNDGDGGRHRPRITAIVLAAGRSTRFGPSNKLLADLDGIPVIRQTVAAVASSSVASTIVVTGHMADDIREALRGLDVTFVDNPSYREGLSTSLKSGLAALPRATDGVLVALGDMPGVTGADIDRLIAGLAPKEGRSIVVPTYQGKRGNPVLFATHLVSELTEVGGDAGAKHVIGTHGDEVAEVEIASRRIFLDIDTPAALEEVKSLD